MSKTKKIVIIVIAVVAALAVAVGCILYFTKRPVKAVDAENVQQAFEIAKENGYKGDFKSWSNTIIYKNDGDKAGIEKVYIDEDEHLMIVLENGVTIDAGEAKTAVADLEKAQAKKESGSSGENVSSKADDKEIYTVTFKDYDGTVLKTERVLEGKAVPQPPEPQRDGYAFTGWDKSAVQIYENCIITAQYEKITGFTLQIKNATVSEGSDTAQVEIEVLNNPGLASLAFDVRYDTTLKIKSVAFDSSKVGKAMATAGEPFSNPQRISVVSPTAPMRFNGTVATITFKLPKGLKEGDVANLAITYENGNIFDADMNNVKTDVIGGKLFITK